MLEQKRLVGFAVQSPVSRVDRLFPEELEELSGKGVFIPADFLDDALLDQEGQSFLQVRRNLMASKGVIDDQEILCGK